MYQGEVVQERGRARPEGSNRPVQKKGIVLTCIDILSLSRKTFQK